MSVRRKRFVVWLAIMVVFVTGVEVLLRTHPEFFGSERPAIYRQLPAVNPAYKFR
jgi:hypothetical protein